jgi:hypothetical protein
VMAPEKRDHKVVRVTNYLYIVVQSSQVLLRVLTVVVHRYFRLLVQDYVDYYPPVCCALKNLVQTVL